MPVWLALELELLLLVVLFQQGGGGTADGQVIPFDLQVHMFNVIGVSCPFIWLCQWPNTQKLWIHPIGAMPKSY